MALPGRRKLLKLMAASSALAGAGCSRYPPDPIVPYVDMPEGTLPGRPVFYATTLSRAGYGQGVLVETNMGRPTKIEGNPDHPGSGGATDIYAQAAILELWDPDRSRTVMHGGGINTWSAFQQSVVDRLGQHAGDPGDGLLLLTGPVSSPTLQAQIRAWLARFPAARWHTHDPAACPASDRSLARIFPDLPTGWARHPGPAQRVPAASRADGGADTVRITTVYHPEAVELLVTLDADLFGEHPDGVRLARQFMSDRGETVRRRLLAVESHPGLCGAAADARLALPVAAIEALLLRIATLLGGGDDSALPADEVSDRWARHLAVQLKQHAGRCLVVPGATLSEHAHQLAWRINQELGNVGRTVTAWSMPGPSGHLGDTLRAVRAGRIRTLVMIDCNPAYDAPAAAGFAEALATVEFSVHMGRYYDETARRCTWHVPQCHELETWSDARSVTGLASLVQPAIDALYGGRSVHELLALMLGEPSQSPYEIVRRHWREVWQPQDDADFDVRWNDSLRRGYVEHSALPALQLPPLTAAVPAPAPTAAGELLAVFAPDPAAEYGSHANNAWLLELPRPFSKLTWDNAVLAGPATAERYGVATGDVVRLRSTKEDRFLEGPLCVVDGVAADTVVLTLGCGRQHAGSVGDEVGFDAYALQPWDGTGAGRTLTVTLEPTGRRHAFARTQKEFSQHGRNVARAAGFKEAQAPSRPKESLYGDWKYPVHAWAMSVDLDRCIGCNACAIACQAENNIPVVGKDQVARGREMQWMRIDLYHEPRRGQAVFQPMACQHCENAPCELVCPVGATMHDSEGLNVQVYNRCVGTRFCSNNCPYKVRHFNFFQYSDETHPSSRARQNPEVTVRQRGVMEKCTYCVQRISRARIQAQIEQRDIRDGEVVTACEAVCPTTAIVFGDLNDPDSRVSRAKRSARDYAALGELNTRPRTTYLARIVDDAAWPGGMDDG